MIDLSYLLCLTKFQENLMEPELQQRLNDIEELVKSAISKAESARAEASDKGHMSIIVLLIFLVAKAC